MIRPKYETIQVPTKQMTGIEPFSTVVEGIPVNIKASNSWHHPYREIKFWLGDETDQWYLSKEGAREFAKIFTELADLMEQP